MKGNIKHYYLSFVLLIILLTANFFLWQVSRNYVTNISHATFNERVLSYSKSANSILEEYMDLPIYGAAFMTHNEVVNRKEFQNYYADILSEKKDLYKAVTAVAFVQNVTDIPAFVTEVKTDKSMSDVGYPFFNVFPPSDEKNAYAINYIIPFEENKSLFGYNLASDPKQAQLMRESVVLREPRATANNIILNASRITIYNPIFRQTIKGLELKGFIAVLLDPDVLFDQLSDTQNSGITASIYNGRTDLKNINAGVQTDDAIAGKRNVYRSAQHLELAKQPFTIVYSSDESVQQTLGQKIVPQVLLYGGSAIIFLLFTTINFMFFSNAEEKEWNTSKEKK